MDAAIKATRRKSRCACSSCATAARRLPSRLPVTPFMTCTFLRNEANLGSRSPSAPCWSALTSTPHVMSSKARWGRLVSAIMQPWTTSRQSVCWRYKLSGKLFPVSRPSLGGGSETFLQLSVRYVALSSVMGLPGVFAAFSSQGLWRGVRSCSGGVPLRDGGVARRLCGERTRHHHGDREVSDPWYGLCSGRCHNLVLRTRPFPCAVWRVRRLPSPAAMWSGSL